MDTEEYLSKSLPKINRRLEKFFPKKLTQKWMEDFVGKPRFVYDLQTLQLAANNPVWNLLDRGGKRWRPALMLLCCSAVCGNSRKAEALLVLPELVHTGTLMIDDVEDSSLLRRGKPCTHIIYGGDTAINAGNLLYFLPLMLLHKNKRKLPPQKINAIYNVYAQEMLRLSFGQAMDIHWHKSNETKISERQYLQMCAYKTGTLARLAAKVGAILGNASKTQINALGDFAEKIGVAFQIQDDILNINPPKKWGKVLGDDITEGKRTLLVIHALKKANKKDKSKLLKILNLHTKNKKQIKEAIKIIEKTNSIKHAKNKAIKLVEGSWDRLAPTLKESKAKKQLRAFADYLVERKI